MPRRNRVSVPGITEHIYQKSLKSREYFGDEEDMSYFLQQLEMYASHLRVSIHAWVLMQDHLHLLCTPTTKEGTSRMMQSLGRKYVNYLNRKYRLEGGLSKGRYKSCLIEDESYFLRVSRFIEQNPLRSGIVEHTSDYTWSSYHSNALGLASTLLTSHPSYARLGKTKSDRCLHYRLLSQKSISSQELQRIRRSVQKGLVYGSQDFITSLEIATGMTFVDRDPGRPTMYLSA